MIANWLDLPTLGIFGVLAAAYGLTAAVIVCASFGTATGSAIRRLDGVVAPFFGAVSILFALLTGFLASDIAERNRQAARAVQVEASELRNIYALSIAAVSDMQAIRTAIVDYAKAAVADEWPAMARDEQAASVAAAYDRLLTELSDTRIAKESGAATHSALLGAAVRAGTARHDRLALAADRTNEIKWATVLILGVITQVSIGLVHLQKRNPQIAALVVFTAAAIVALGLIALQERPFAGDVRVPPTPLRDVAALPPS